MHNRGRSQEMYAHAHYADVAGEVAAELAARVAAARARRHQPRSHHRRPRARLREARRAHVRRDRRFAAAGGARLADSRRGRRASRSSRLRSVTSPRASACGARPRPSPRRSSSAPTSCASTTSPRWYRWRGPRTLSARRQVRSSEVQSYKAKGSSRCLPSNFELLTLNLIPTAASQSRSRCPPRCCG